MGFFDSIRNFFRSLFRGRASAEEVTGPQDGAESPDDAVLREVETELVDLEPELDSAESPVAADGDDDSPATEVAAAHVPRYLWCLDNGHGKGTPGKRSPKFTNGDQFFEYEFNRDIVARIKQGLDAQGIRYHEICPELEGDVPLKTRVERANQLDSALPKFFLSIHANAFGNGSSWTSAKGIETWYYKGSAKGIRLASELQRELVAANGWNDRGIKCNADTSKAFYVLRKTKMAAALTENGFYTNQDECRQMLNPAVRAKIAQAHINAIRAIEDGGINDIAIHSKNSEIG